MQILEKEGKENFTHNLFVWSMNIPKVESFFFYLVKLCLSTLKKKNREILHIHTFDFSLVSYAIYVYLYRGSGDLVTVVKLLCKTNEATGCFC